MKKSLKVLLLSLMAVLMCGVALSVTACSSKQTYTLTFISEGTTHAEITAKEGANITPPREPEAQNAGYVFDGWYLDADFSGERQTVPSVMPRENITYYAKFAALAQLTVNNGNGAEPITYNVAVGTNVLQFLSDKSPSASGLIFGGWFSGNTQLTSSSTVPAAGLTVSARYKIEYTVKAYKQNQLGTYSKTPEESKATGWVDSTLTASDVDFAHFQVDESQTEYIKLTLGGENVFTVYLKRNVYNIYYDPNEPVGESVAGNMTPSSAMYELPVTVSENLYSISGYRFAGWALSASGDADASYNPNLHVLLESDVVLYARWDKGYTDRFGGNDLIYLPEREENTVYLEREGLDEKKGSYNPETRVFTFEYEAGGELSGKLAIDGSFAYYGDENPGTYKLINAYSSSEFADKNWTLTLDNYDGAVLKTDVGTFNGNYSIDAESGDFHFVADAGTPSTYAEFYFTIGTFGTNDELAFAVRGEEYGIHYSLDGYRFSTPIVLFDGYGTAMYMTESSTQYGTYNFAENFEQSKEIEISLLAYDKENSQYYISEVATCKLLGKTEATDTTTGEVSEVGILKVRDKAVGKYALGSGQDVTLELDGYGAGWYLNSSKRENISYTLDGTIVSFTLNKNRYVFNLDLEEKIYDADVGKEQGKYLLYVPFEEQPYTTTLTLDGKGNAVWYVNNMASGRKQGAYVYNEQTNLVTCTADGIEYVYLLDTVTWHDSEYAVYMEKLTVVLNENKNDESEVWPNGSYGTEVTLELDGYGNARYGSAEGAYSLELRKGYDEIFVLFYQNTELKHTFLVKHSDSSYLYETNAAVGEYSSFKFDGVSFKYDSYALRLFENNRAELLMSSWNGTKKIGDGKYESKGDGKTYTFTLNDPSVTQVESLKKFDFIFSNAPNGTRVYIAYNEAIDFDYQTEDGTEILSFDGYGYATYTVNGSDIVSSKFEIQWGNYKLTDGETEYSFTTYEKDGVTYFVRAGKEARIYTLYDPTGTEKQQMIIDGNGKAELFRYNSTDEKYETLVYGTYMPTERDDEWEFISSNKNLSSDFRFILPSDAPYIAFMKYNELADGRFDSQDWTILILDGYYGYYTGAKYIEAKGVTHIGTYTAEGQSGNVVVFTDSTSKAKFNLKLSETNTFKRLGDERGDYVYYVPITNAMYSMPLITLDGEGGAILQLNNITSVNGNYALYGDSRNEYTFTYIKNGKTVSFRFRTSTYGSRLTFLLHDDNADGTFAGADGTLEVDGYYNGIYTDANGVKFTGYYVSAQEIPLSNGKDFLMTFVGLKEGGNIDNEQDVAMLVCIVSHINNTLKRVGEEAGFYYEYRPTTMGVYRVQLLLDGDGNAYLQNPDKEGEYEKGTYTLNIETAEGSFTIGNGNAVPFRLMEIQTSLSSTTLCFVKYDEKLAGEYSSAELGTLTLDGFGEGVYVDAAGNTFNGVITGIYETEYITDPTIIFTPIGDDGYAGDELFFKLNREQLSFKAAGNEVNTYYGYRVDSLGGTYNQNQQLILDGDGKAEYYELEKTSELEGEYVLVAAGTYTVKSTETNESGNTTVTYTFVSLDGNTTFDFQFRYIQEYFMGGLVPCFAKYDDNFNGTYTGTTTDDLGNTVNNSLTINGYELATYTLGEETYSGTYSISYEDGKTLVKFTARNEKGQSIATATFSISNDGKTLTVVSALKGK